MFENGVRRRIFGAKRDEVTVEWRRLHYAELKDPYSIQNITEVIKTRLMRWAGHVARMGPGAVHTAFWWGNMEDPGVDGRMILKLILVGGMLETLDWIDRAQNRDRCQVFVNAVMNLSFHKMRGNS